MSLPPRTIADTLPNFPNCGMEPIPAPEYRSPSSGDERNRVMFAVSSMKDHMTDEGWQIALALQHTGYKLCGYGIPHGRVIPKSLRRSQYADDGRTGLTDTQAILQELSPHTLVIQDKREWDLAHRDFRDPNARLVNPGLLRDRDDVFKVTILKDAHQRPGYHRESAEEMGVHAWITYYHTDLVMRAAPYVRRDHIIRTYHTTDKDLPGYRWLEAPNHKRDNKTLLSGAISGVYPLRAYIRDHVDRLPSVNYLRHPGYHRSGCATPSFIEELTKYKVAICTSSAYGYTLRKIIEATAAGCIVITDLPVDERLPYIDGNLVRVHPSSNFHDLYHVIVRAYRDYDLERQRDFARDCLAYYDYRSMGARLAVDIERARRAYPWHLTWDYSQLVDSELQCGTRPGKLEDASLTIEVEEPQAMTEQEALAKMVAPGQRRESKWRGGVIQIWVTRVCDKACFNCTQGSNLDHNNKKDGYPWFITPEQFEQACLSLKGYFGVVGMFGGNPAAHPKFVQLCEIMRKHIPFEQRGLWCNNLISQEKGAAARETFNPAYSNLNVHLDANAFQRFRDWWPESRPFGLHQDSRHSPPYVAMKDVLKKICPTCSGTHADPNDRGEDVEGASATRLKKCPTCKGSGVVYDEPRAWELISNCDINQHWSAMIGVFRGQLRAWFCEIAGAQAMLHQNEPDYPDTGFPLPQRDYVAGPDQQILVTPASWWQLPMQAFREQVRKHCHECGVPLRGYGELAQAKEGKEQVSACHSAVYSPKTVGRQLEIVTDLVQLDVGKLSKTTDYLGNSQK